MDEWQTAMQDAVEAGTDPSAVTAADLAKQFNISASSMQRRLRKMQEKGTVTVVRKVITDRTGRQQTVTAYKVKK